MVAAGVNAPVSAVLQENPSEVENGYDQLAISVILVALLHKPFHAPCLFFAIFDRRPGIQEKIACKVSHLEALLQLVCGAKRFENVVESVQQRDPVVEIATWKRPSRWELVELPRNER